MSGNSWVTLATNDSYSLGALVLARSLRRVETVHNITVMVTPGVSPAMRNQLASVFNVVQEVNILDSKDEKNLALLTRPDLGITFTKLHCWRLIQFTKCVFLDADVLVLQNCDELFDREELSAAPDVGWPDCFNSGVFVYRPSIETYNAIINFALTQGSFDGGDQGLLNLFFADWATKDISRHLPFIYNMCSTATYSYLPAFKQFGKDVKIVHFIGAAKPWLQYLDSETRQVKPSSGSEHLQALLQLWWDIFCHDIHSQLSSEMAGLAGALSKLTLGVARSPEQIALEEHMRKQAWEHGNIDYMGRDSFDNIWAKICQTIGEEPSATPLPEQSKESSQVSSVVVDTVSQGDTPAADTSLSSALPGLPSSVSVPKAIPSGVEAGAPASKLEAVEQYSSTIVAASEKCDSSFSIPETEILSASASAPAPTSSAVPSVAPVPIPAELQSSEQPIQASPVGTDDLQAALKTSDVAPPITSASQLPQPTPDLALRLAGETGSAASEKLPPAQILPAEPVPENLPSQEFIKPGAAEPVSPSSDIKAGSVPSIPSESLQESIPIPSDSTLEPHEAVPLESKGPLSSPLPIPSAAVSDAPDVSKSQVQPEAGSVPSPVVKELPQAFSGAAPSPSQQKADETSPESPRSGQEGKPSVGVEELSSAPSGAETVPSSQQITEAGPEPPSSKPVGKQSEGIKEHSSLEAQTLPSPQQIAGKGLETISSSPEEKQSIDSKDLPPVPSGPEILSSPQVAEIAPEPVSPSLQEKKSSDKEAPSVPSGVDAPPSPQQSVDTAPAPPSSTPEDKKPLLPSATGDSQTVTVTAPTPPTSPSDSSFTAPAVPALQPGSALAVDSSIPDTPPVGAPPTGAELAQGMTPPTSPTDPEGPEASEGTSQPSDPKAPVPPKRRHKPSQKPDPQGKPGKSSKPQPGKK